jgi:sugar-specific transcriptional regulator TrmB
LSLERIIKTLEGFGLKRIEAEVYIYLAKKGALKVEKLSAALRLNKRKLNLILDKLQNRGLVTRKSKHPEIYSAMAIEEVLELYIKLDLEEAQAINKTKKELLARWQSLLK